MATTLYALIERSATMALDLQQQDGSMPSGHNGPYHDDETPVRNTAHWLITFEKAYRISGEQKFWRATRRAADYLLSREARPMEASFWHRKNPEKDTCNGLIGQAWTIEALVVAAELFDEDAFIGAAEDVFLLHPFQEELGLWRCVAADGQYLSVDRTLNHQIWFAASGALLAPHAAKPVRRRVDRFMDRLDRHFRTYGSGLIRHRINSTRTWKGRILSGIRRVTRASSARKARKSKEIGYHAFNLYGLGLLHKFCPNHAFWDAALFRKACAYVQSDAFRRAIQDSPYGFPYNPPGFEVAFALDVFGPETDEEQAYWIGEQIDRCYDWTSHLMTQQAPDPATQAARLYEAARLPDVEVSVPNREVASSPAGGGKRGKL